MPGLVLFYTPAVWVYLENTAKDRLCLASLLSSGAEPYYVESELLVLGILVPGVRWMDRRCTERAGEVQERWHSRI